MPKSTREWAKRKLEESVKNIDWAGTHIYEVTERYKADHPEVSEPLQMVLDTLAELQTLINRVRVSF